MLQVPVRPRAPYHETYLATTTAPQSPALQAVPHPGFSTTDRCMKQNMLEDVLDSYLTAGTVVRVRLIDRVETCEVITERPLQEEATQIVTGGMLALRCGRVCKDWAGVKLA